MGRSATRTQPSPPDPPWGGVVLERTPARMGAHTAMGSIWIPSRVPESIAVVVLRRSAHLR